jgi:hypothetical protein
MCLLTGDELYLVGVADEDREAWDLVGVFRDKVEAERECCDGDHFVRTVTLNEPVEPGEWGETYFPKSEEAES